MAFKRRTETNRIILHDSHTTPDLSSPAEALRHTGRRMGLLEAGYHYAIAGNANVFLLRPSWSIGSHTPGHNHDSIGICLIGGRDPKGKPDDNFTPPQLMALKSVLGYLRETYRCVVLVGHTEIQRYRYPHPPCPILNMKWLREWSDFTRKGPWAQPEVSRQVAG